MLHAIVDYRRSQGVEHGFLVDHVVNGWCQEHSWAMARRCELYHSPDDLRGDWAEAVGMCSMSGSYEDTIRKMLYDVFGESEAHRGVILRCSTLAWGIVIHEGKMYMTIRGR